MNFYYDSILGLQYTCLGETFIIDIEVIPKFIDIKGFLENWKEMMYCKGIESSNGVECFLKITDYKL